MDRDLDLDDIAKAANGIGSDSRKLRQEIENFIDIYFTWAPIRAQTICVVREIGKRIDKHHKNANISKIVGGVAALGGAGMAGLGVGLAPLTQGLSIPFLTVPGVAISSAGGATGVGGIVADHVLRKKNKDEAMDILKTDQRITESLASCIVRIQQLTDHIETAATFIAQHHQTQEYMYECALGGNPSRCDVDSGTGAMLPVTETSLVNPNTIEEVLCVAMKYLRSLQEVLPAEFNARNVYKAISSLAKVLRPRFIEAFKTIRRMGSEMIRASRALLVSRPDILAEAGILVVGGAGILVAGGAAILVGIGIVLTAIDMYHGSKTETAKDLFSVGDKLELEQKHAQNLFEVLLSIASNM